MNLLILEYVSGGGYANQKLPASILSEGYGMQRSLISDFKAAGHNVTALMDSRLKRFNPPNTADQTVAVASPNQLHTKLKELSGGADAVYVIAPESGKVLENLVQTVEDLGETSLNCTVDSIRRVSDKMLVTETLEKARLKVPETVLLNVNEKTDNIKRLTKELGYPLVFKPLDGVGCSGLSIVKNERDVEAATKKVTKESTGRQFIAQNLVCGEATSACVISTGDEAVAVSLNSQFVTLGSPDEESEYRGGAVPFDHSLEEEALGAAEKAVKCINGLKGYVGVDMILTDGEPVVMEINPRLTTSYVGLRKVAEFNPAETIIEAVIKQKLQENVQHRGYSYFAKVKVPPRHQILAETYRLKDVVSPPFPIEDKTACALIATASTTLKGAESAFHRAREQLLKLYSIGD